MEELKSILATKEIILKKKEELLKRTSISVREKEFFKEEGQKLIERIHKLKETIPKRFTDKTFSNFRNELNKDAFKICREYSRNFIDNLKKGKGLFLVGQVGSGKTHLAVSIIDYIARIHKRKRINIIFTTAVNLLSEIKYSYQTNDTERTVKQYERCSLLVIDDLGVEKETDWVNELFYKIIDTRYSEMLPTIITTNLTDKEIKEKLSERVISRIIEMTDGIKLTGKDYRIWRLNEISK